jgi:hypothetical protein
MADKDSFSPVLNEAEKLNIRLLCLPAHCSHDLRPLDVFCLQISWNEALDNKRRKNLGRENVKLQFPKPLAEAWMKTAAPQVAVAGFKCTGTYPFNPDVLSETASAPSSVSECPIHCNANRSQETLPGRNNQEMYTAPKEAALPCSTSIDRSARNILPSPKTDRKDSSI